MFQEATDNTNDTDILARAGHFRPQTTDAADDQSMVTSAREASYSFSMIS